MITHTTVVHELVVTQKKLAVTQKYASLSWQFVINKTSLHSSIIVKFVKWLTSAGEEVKKCIDSNLQAIESNNMHSSFKKIQAAVLLKDITKAKSLSNQFLDNLNKIDIAVKITGLTKEQRLKVYKNITYIKEHSSDIENVELVPLLKEKEKINRQLQCKDRISKESLSLLSSSVKTISSLDVDKEILH